MEKDAPVYDEKLTPEQQIRQLLAVTPVVRGLYRIKKKVQRALAGEPVSSRRPVAYVAKRTKFRLKKWFLTGRHQ